MAGVARPGVRGAPWGDIVAGGAVFLLAVLSGKTYRAYASPSAVFFTPTAPVPAFGEWHYGLLLGGVVLASYALFRCVAGKPLAVVGSLMIATSPLQLYISRASPDRDYGRGPYLLAALFGMALLVWRNPGRGRMLFAAAFIGAMCGLGARQREEPVLFLLPATIALVFLTPWTNGVRIRWKVEALALMAVAFLVVAPRPILRFDPRQSSALVVSPWNRDLGLSDARYDVGYLFLDEQIAAANSLLEASGNGTQSPLRRYFYFFPADFLVRVYASAQRVLALPFVFQLPPPGISSPAVRAFYSARGAFQSLLTPLAIPCFVGAILVLCLTDLPLAALTVLWLGFLSGLFVAQFHARHYFYAEFFSWWTLFACVSSWKQRRAIAESSRAAVLRACACTAAILLVPALALADARIVQGKRMRGLFHEYLRAPTAPRSEAPRETASGVVFFPRPHPSASGGQAPTVPDFFAVEWNGANCERKVAWPVLRYAESPAGGPRYDWSRTLAVPTRTETSAAVRLYFPAWDGFKGIEISKDEAECLRWFRRVEVPLPRLLLTATVPTDGDMGTLYQQLENGESGRIRSVAGGAPPDLVKQARGGTERSLQPEDWSFLSPLVQREGNGWNIAGYAVPPRDPHAYPAIDRSRSVCAAAWHADVSVNEIDTDLAYTRPLRLLRGALVVVEGHLFNGGVTVGLTRGGRSEGAVSVTTPGSFSTLLPVAFDGDYVLCLANQLSWYSSLENRVAIRKTAIVDSDSYTRK